MIQPKDQQVLETLIHELRLLVFLEVEPQSNKYNQVYLDAEQFKKVSDSIVIRKLESNNMKEGFELCENAQSDEEYVLPDLQSINP